MGRIAGDVDAIERAILDSIRFILLPLAVMVMGPIHLPLTLLVMVVSPTAVGLTRRLAYELRDRQEDILDHGRTRSRAHGSRPTERARNVF